jgi:hypothetical protein
MERDNSDQKWRDQLADHQSCSFRPASFFPIGERLRFGILRLLETVNNPWNGARARRDVAPGSQ